MAGNDIPKWAKEQGADQMPELETPQAVMSDTSLDIQSNFLRKHYDKKLTANCVVKNTDSAEHLIITVTAPK